MILQEQLVKIFWAAIVGFQSDQFWSKSDASTTS
jgi:hypothetical protein